jgi:hypothetical protein
MCLPADMERLTETMERWRVFRPRKNGIGGVVKNKLHPQDRRHVAEAVKQPEVGLAPATGSTLL